MEKITLIANLVFLLLMIIFALKLRADFEELKKKVENMKDDEQKSGKSIPFHQEELSKTKEEINEMKFRIVALEDKVISLEYDTKEIHEKIGVLSEKIKGTEKKTDTKERESVEKPKESIPHTPQNTEKLSNGDILRNKEELIDTHKQKSVDIANTHGKIENYDKTNTQDKMSVPSSINIQSNLKDAVIFYAQKGMKEEEIAKKLGITYEEVKLILFMMKK